MNQIVVKGNVGKDPTFTTTKTGKSVGKFSLADKIGEKTQWHSIVCWEEVADALTCVKGSFVQVVGKIKYREYEGKWYTDVVAESVAVLGRKKTRGEGDASTTSAQQTPPAPQDSDMPDFLR